MCVCVRAYLSVPVCVCLTLLMSCASGDSPPSLTQLDFSPRFAARCPFPLGLWRRWASKSQRMCMSFGPREKLTTAGHMLRFALRVLAV